MDCGVMNYLSASDVFASNMRLRKCITCNGNVMLFNNDSGLIVNNGKYRYIWRYNIK